MSKKYLLIFLISLIVLVPRETFAAVTWNWTDGEQLRTPSISNAYTCSNSSCPKFNNWQSYDFTNEYMWTQSQTGLVDYYKEYQVFGTSSNVTFSANDPGLLISFMPSTYLLPNYYYSLTFYMCTSDNINLNLINSYSGRNDNDFINRSFPNTGQGTNWLNVTNRPFFQSDNQPYTNCRTYSHIFRITHNNNKAEYIGLLFNTGSTAKTISHIALFGYNLTSLGADVSSLPTTSNFNNLQTSISGVQSSVNNVQSSVNSVKNDTNEIKQEAKATNDTLNNDTVNESDNYLQNNIVNNSAFNQDHGITAVIQAPINFLQSLNSKTCSSIVLPIPNLGNATIPCMSTIYSSKFNDLYSIIKIIINGVICYRLALSVVLIVKGAKNPNEDKIEVMDL